MLTATVNFDMASTTATTPWFPVVCAVSRNSYRSSTTLAFVQVRDDRISFKEQVRRMKQSLAELCPHPERRPIRKFLKPANPTQGRHGFQMSFRLPCYRSKRPA